MNFVSDRFTPSTVDRRGQFSMRVFWIAFLRYLSLLLTLYTFSFFLVLGFFSRARYQLVWCSETPLDISISYKIHPVLGSGPFHGFRRENLFTVTSNIIITTNHDLLAIIILQAHNIFVTEIYSGSSVRHAPFP